jgi:hypothetical protein
MVPGHFQGHSPLLYSLLSCSKMTQPLNSVILAGVTRDHSSLAILDFFYPIATLTRDNDEFHMAHLLKELAPECEAMRCAAMGKTPGQFSPATPRRLVATR